MLNLFRQNTFFAAILMVVVALVLKIPIFLNPHPYEPIQTAPLANIVLSYVSTIPNYLLVSYIIALLFLIIQAISINYVVTQHGILYKDTYLPALFFILLNSLYPQQAELSPQLISNTFIILMFHRLCFLYESSNPLLIVLDAGMYLGTALLFNYDVAIFLPHILICVIIFTSFNFRYLVLSLLGIFIPLYFAAIVFYLNNQWDAVIEFTIHSFQRTLLTTSIDDSTIFIPLLVLLPIVFISTLNLQLNFFRNKVKTRRILQSVGLLFVFGILGLVIENTHFIYALFYLSIPLCIVVAYYFINPSKAWFKEILFFTLIGLSLYYNLR